MRNIGTEFWQFLTNKTCHQLMRSRRSETGPVLHGSREMASTDTLTCCSLAFFQKTLCAPVQFSIYAALLGFTNTETIEIKERCTWVSFIFVVALSVFLAGRFFWALDTSWVNCFGGRTDTISRRLAEFVVCTLLPRGFVPAPSSDPRTERTLRGEEWLQVGIPRIVTITS